MTESTSQKRQRLMKCVYLAKKYRESTGVKSRFVKVLWGEVTGVCEEMPPIISVARPGNPILVTTGDVVFQVENGKWKEKKIVFNGDEVDFDVRKPKTFLSEHMASVLKGEMINFYPFDKERITNWFNSCKTDLEDKGWRKLESLSVNNAYKLMISGRTLDSLLVTKSKPCPSKYAHS